MSLIVLLDVEDFHQSELGSTFHYTHCAFIIFIEKWLEVITKIVFEKTV
jgi:hypothetical protein